MVEPVRADRWHDGTADRDGTADEPEESIVTPLHRRVGSVTIWGPPVPRTPPDDADSYQDSPLDLPEHASPKQRRPRTSARAAPSSSPPRDWPGPTRQRRGADDSASSSCNDTASADSPPPEFPPRNYTFEDVLSIHRDAGQSGSSVAQQVSRSRSGSEEEEKEVEDGPPPPLPDRSYTDETFMDNRPALLPPPEELRSDPDTSSGGSPLGRLAAAKRMKGRPLPKEPTASKTRTELTNGRPAMPPQPEPLGSESNHETGPAPSMTGTTESAPLAGVAAAASRMRSRPLPKEPVPKTAVRQELSVDPWSADHCYDEVDAGLVADSDEVDSDSSHEYVLSVLEEEERSGGTMPHSPVAPPCVQTLQQWQHHRKVLECATPPRTSLPQTPEATLSGHSSALSVLPVSSGPSNLHMQSLPRNSRMMPPTRQVMPGVNTKPPGNKVTSLPRNITRCQYPYKPSQPQPQAHISNNISSTLHNVSPCIDPSLSIPGMDAERRDPSCQPVLPVPPRTSRVGHQESKSFSPEMIQDTYYVNVAASQQQNDNVSAGDSSDDANDYVNVEGDSEDDEEYLLMDGSLHEHELLQVRNEGANYPSHFAKEKLLCAENEEAIADAEKVRYAPFTQDSLASAKMRKPSKSRIKNLQCQATTPVGAKSMENCHHVAKHELLRPKQRKKMK